MAVVYLPWHISNGHIYYSSVWHLCTAGDLHAASTHVQLKKFYLWLITLNNENFV